MQRARLHSLVLLSAVLFCGRAAAEASLFIYPTLVMFEGNAASAEITIANRGDETGTFEIGWSNMSMTPEGGLVRHEEDVPWSIQAYVRYSPRRVTLAPSESQVIKIALRRDSSLADGEYYSHMRVLTINSAAVNADSPEAPATVPGVSITARSAIAIPVIWRKGRAEERAAIESIELDLEANALRIYISREGLFSARGFLHLVAPSAGNEREELTAPMPVIIYPNIDRRSVSLSLPEGVAVGSLPRGAAVLYAADETLTERTPVYSTRLVHPDQ